MTCPRCHMRMMGERICLICSDNDRKLFYTNGVQYRPEEGKIPKEENRDFIFYEESTELSEKQIDYLMRFLASEVEEIDWDAELKKLMEDI